MHGNRASGTTQPAFIPYWTPFAIWNALRHEHMSGIPGTRRRAWLREALEIAARNLDRYDLPADASRVRAVAADPSVPFSLGYRCLRVAVKKIVHELCDREQVKLLRGDLAAMGIWP